MPLESPDLTELTTASPVLVNFDWTDLSGGTGYIRFLAAAGEDTGGQEYFLTRQTIDAFPQKTSVLSGGLDLDFDIDFNINSTVSGTAIINFTQTIGGASNQITTINIYHVDASGTETLIGTKICITRNGAVNYRECLKIDLTEKVFVKGTKLRLNVISTISVSITGFIFHDPASSESVTDVIGRTVGTDFTFDVPFKISR